MNTKIEFEYENQKYTLEYTRESIALMEKQGFLAEDIVAKPMLMLPLAFEGLFYKNHRNINKPKIDEIFNLFKDKSKLINTIIKMLDESYLSLTENNEGNDKGNIDWKIV